jgi:hypothetical protein
VTVLNFRRAAKTEQVSEGQRIECLGGAVYLEDRDLRPYSKSSLTLTLNEWSLWRFNLHECQCCFSVVRYYVTTHPPAIQKQH